MAYIFRPPTVDEAPGIDVGGRLFGRVKYPRGISVLVDGFVVTQQRWPTIEQQQAADATYLGGHEYLLTDEQAQVLLKAGYGEYLEHTQQYVDTYEDVYTGEYD